MSYLCFYYYTCLYSVGRHDIHIIYLFIPLRHSVASSAIVCLYFPFWLGKAECACRLLESLNTVARDALVSVRLCRTPATGEDSNST